MWQVVVWIFGILRGMFAMNGMVTRGPINGRHVSHTCWFKIYAFSRTRPRDLQAGEEPWEGSSTGVPPHVTCNINGAYYIYVEIYYMVGADWAGA
jgi:hypothetical protein